MQPLPHGYTNDTRGDSSTVVKRYQGPRQEERRSTELLALSRMAGLVPIPQLLAAEDGAISMERVSGVHGQELVDAGHAAAVLRSCGQTLRQLQSVNVEVAFPDAPPGCQYVVVHGDYGPNNMLFDPVTFAATAVLDWEWAHPGDPVEDVAWCEWIIRMHHPDAVDALEHFFAGYGHRPPWEVRKAAALAKCHALLALTSVDGLSGPGARKWQRFIEITTSWVE